MGLVGYLVVSFLLPIILSSNRLLAGLGAAAPVERALFRIHSDVYQATRKGLNFMSSPSGDWTLALVLRSHPSSDAVETWEKSLRVYRYHADSKTLGFTEYKELVWADGSPRLTGTEPLHFSNQELAVLPAVGEAPLAKFIDAPVWPSLDSSWEFDYRAPSSTPVHYLLSLSGDLD